MSTVTYLQRGGGESHLWERVSEEIRVLMVRKGVRQADLAKALGVSQPQVSARLGGRAPWKLDEIERAAEWLGVDPVTLLGGIPKGPRPEDGGRVYAARESNPQPAGKCIILPFAA